MGMDALAELKRVKFDPHRFLEPLSEGDATGSVSHLQPLTLIQCNLKWIQLDSVTFNSLCAAVINHWHILWICQEVVPNETKLKSLKTGWWADEEDRKNRYTQIDPTEAESQQTTG